MKTQPTQPYNPTFGIYKGFKSTSTGGHTWGKYKGYNIDIYTDNKDMVKLQYISDADRKWIKSKLTYFYKGIKKILKSNHKEK